MGRIHAFDGVAILIDVVGTEHADAEKVQREGDSLPVFVENGLVALDLDRTEAVHSSEVVNAVHVVPSF